MSQTIAPTLSPIPKSPFSFPILPPQTKAESNYCANQSNFTDPQCTRQGFDHGRVNHNFVLLHEEKVFIPGRRDNDYYSQKPPRMSDGRFLTYHGSSSELTDAIRKANGFESENEFRTYLQNNADPYMKLEKQYHLQQNSPGMSNYACSDGYSQMLHKQHIDSQIQKE